MAKTKFERGAHFICSLCSPSKMSKQCLICGKKSILAWKLVKLRGKYNPTTKRRKYPNLQWVLVPAGIKKETFRKFIGKRILACTKCIKAIGKV